MLLRGIERTRSIMINRPRALRIQGVTLCKSGNRTYAAGSSKLCPRSANRRPGTSINCAHVPFARLHLGDTRGESRWHDYKGLIRESRDCWAAC